MGVGEGGTVGGGRGREHEEGAEEEKRGGDKGRGRVVEVVQQVMEGEKKTEERRLRKEKEGRLADDGTNLETITTGTSSAQRGQQKRGAPRRGSAPF